MRREVGRSSYTVFNNVSDKWILPEVHENLELIAPVIETDIVVITGVKNAEKVKSVKRESFHPYRNIWEIFTDAVALQKTKSNR